MAYDRLYSQPRFVPFDLPMGPHFPAAEVEAARRRVVVKRALRRHLAALGIQGVVVR